MSLPRGKQRRMLGVRHHSEEEKMGKRRWLTVVACSVMLTQAGADAASLALVRDGKARARTVVPDNAFPVVRYAAEELRYHIGRATASSRSYSWSGHIPGATASSRSQGLITED